MKPWFSTTPDTDYQQGTKFFAAKDYRQALNFFNKALQIDAKDEKCQSGKFDALCQLAAKSKDEKDLDMAESYLRQAHDLQPTKQVALNELANIRRQRYLQKQSRENAAAAAVKVAAPVPTPAPSAAPANKVHNLIFQGGGIKELACLGALQALAEHIDLAEIKRVGGNSAGSILATLWGVGYSLPELEKMLKEMKFDHFMDGEYREDLLKLGQRQEQLKQLGKDVAADMNKIKNASRNPIASPSGASGLSNKASSDVDVTAIKRGLKLLNNETDFGLFPGDFFCKWLESCLQAKTGIAHITFKELQTLRAQRPEDFKDSKDIYMVGANISTGMTEVFSHETTPDMIISDAVRISISIPLVFRPHRMYIKNDKGERIAAASNHWYVDGGLLDNYPLWLFDKAKYVPESKLEAGTVLQNPYSLGLRLVDNKLKQCYQTGTPLPANEPPTSLAGYAWQLIHTMHRKQESHHYHFNEQARTIYIDHNGILATQFDLNDEQQQKLLANGKAAVKEYFAAAAKATPVSAAADEKDVLAKVKDEKQTGALAVSKALADAKKQEDDLEYAVETDNVKRAHYLLLQGIKAKPGIPSILDKAMLKGNKAMVLVLVEADIYQCQQPKAVHAILSAALQSEFIDKVSLSTHLQEFERQHGLAMTPSRLPTAAPA